MHKTELLIEHQNVPGALKLMLHGEELPVPDMSERWNCEDVAQLAFDDTGKEVGNENSIKTSFNNTS
jgi:hypothetical protein